MKEEKKRISHINIWIILTLFTIPILILIIIIFLRDISSKYIFFFPESALQVFYWLYIS